MKYKKYIRKSYKKIMLTGSFFLVLFSYMLLKDIPFTTFLFYVFVGAYSFFHHFDR